MIQHGKDLKITTTNGGVLVALAKSCEINVDCDDIEISSPYDGMWKDFITGRKEWSVSVGYLLTAEGLAADMTKVGTVVNLKMTDGENGTPLTGTAIVKKWKVTGNVSDLAKGSFIFKGKGPLTYPEDGV